MVIHHILKPGKLLLLLCQRTHITLHACGLPSSFSVHLASSAVTPAGSVHKSIGDNVGAVEERMCVVYVSVTKGTWLS